MIQRAPGKDLDKTPRADLGDMGDAIATAITRAMLHRADNRGAHGVGVFLEALAARGYTVSEAKPAKTARPPVARRPAAADIPTKTVKAPARRRPATDPFTVPA